MIEEDCFFCRWVRAAAGGGGASCEGTGTLEEKEWMKIGNRWKHRRN